MRIAELDEATAPAWAALFAACGSACFCRYWHFEGNKNAWLARCVDHPEDNRDEQLALLRTGSADARGLVALDGPTAVGWMKLTPRRSVPKLLRQGAYRALDLGDGERVWSIGCLLVDPAWRARGVARALVSAAAEYVRRWAGVGGEAAASGTVPCVVEAYPRGPLSDFEPPRLHDEEVWMGTVRLYESCGFERVAGERAYPVMRKTV
jgi:GNAT superfamily N-acetyltransferase